MTEERVKGLHIMFKNYIDQDYDHLQEYALTNGRELEAKELRDEHRQIVQDIDSLEVKAISNL